MVAPKLTTTDISIDILLAIIWLVVVLRSFYSIFFVTMCFRMKVISVLITLVGIIYIYQALYTLQTGIRAPARLWDFYNMLVLLGFHIIARQWYRSKSLEWEKDI